MCKAVLLDLNRALLHSVDDVTSTFASLTLSFTPCAGLSLIIHPPTEASREMSGSNEENYFGLSPTSSTPPDPSEILTTISCVLSLCCGVIILVLICRRHLVLGTCHFMFVCLTIADMMTAGGNLFGVVNKFVNADYLPANTSSAGRATVNSCTVTSPECKIQSFITTWSSMCCFLWTIIIECYCFYCVWRRKHHVPLSSAWKWLISLFCWLVPRK